MTTSDDTRQPKHHLVLMTSRGRGWAQCWCGWTTDPKVNGNKNWAQLEFAKHLAEASR